VQRPPREAEASSTDQIVLLCMGSSTALSTLPIGV
jgi:hypothetical protein